MKSRFTINIFLFSLISTAASGQISIKEQDYSVIYNQKDITLSFDKDVSFSAYNANSLSAKNIRVDSNKNYTYIITNPEPAEFITFKYSLKGVPNDSLFTGTLAAPSASTGEIKVYFNHVVNNSVAQYQNAMNLGNTLDDMLISYINACQSSLDIAIYNSYSPNSTSGIAGAINNAYSRGVRVRVIYDGSTGSQMISHLNPGIPRLASPNDSAYGIMHNKFVVFDADSTDPTKPWIWSGATNWTVAQIDGPDKNNAIAIQDQALAQAYEMEFEEMWGSSVLMPDATISRFGPYKTNNTPHNFIIGGKVVKNYFSPTDGVTNEIINLINTADNDLEIATMLITRDDIRDAIIAKKNAGLNIVQGVFDTQNPSGNDIPALQSAIGFDKMVKYGGAGVMHHKFMLVDNFNAASDPAVLTGSHNWSTSAETRNDENTLIIYDKAVTDQYYQAFHYLYLEAGGTLAVAEQSSNHRKVIIYPNPTADKVFIKVDENLRNSKGSIEVYNVVGTKLTEKTFTRMSEASIDLTNYPPGIYFLKIQADNYTYQGKVIKK